MQKKIRMRRLSEILKKEHTNESDIVLRKAIQHYFNRSLKNELIRDLAKNHNIYRQHKKSFLNIRYIYLATITIAACLLALVLFRPLLQPDLNRLMKTYLSESHLPHPGNLKGINTENQRILAISAYNQNDFENAAKYFDVIATKTNTDLLYNGLSHFYSGSYQRASEIFIVLDSADHPYNQELKWYMALNFVALDDTSKARIILLEIQSDDWKYEDAQKLLSVL